MFHPSNGKLATLFKSFEEQNILFPENTTIIFKRHGISMMKQNGVETEIYNLKKEKRNSASQRESDLEEKLRLLTLEADDDSGSYEEDDDEDLFYQNTPQAFTPLSAFMQICRKSQQKQETSTEYTSATTKSAQLFA